MNEIFAVILCTLRDEYVEKIPAYWEHCQDPAHLKTDEMLLELCDIQHLFADTFMLFEKILDQGISSMYFNADEEQASSFVSSPKFHTSSSKSLLQELQSNGSVPEQ